MVRANILGTFFGAKRIKCNFQTFRTLKIKNVIVAPQT